MVTARVFLPNIKIRGESTLWMNEQLQQLNRHHHIQSAIIISLPSRWHY